MRRFLRDYSLTLAFLLQFVVSLVLYWHFLNLHTAHPDVVLYEYLAGVFENLESEAWQVGMLILLATHLIHKDSPQSRDGQDRLETKVDEILDQLSRLDGDHR